MACCTKPRHGMRDWPEYLVWLEMKQRCTNPKHKHFDCYGGRGIVVCARWSRSFKNFIEDMGRRPPGLTLDRRDPNGDYEKENCRWASWGTQRRNKRSNVWIEFGGRRMIIQDWALETGISAGTLLQRFHAGWNPARMLTERPVTQRSNNRWITFEGQTKTAADWAREKGIKYQTLKTRLNVLKWPAERALSA